MLALATLLALLPSAHAAMSCEDVLFLVRSDVPRANILYTLTQAELQPGAAECLLRNGVPMEYIEAASAPPAKAITAARVDVPEPGAPVPAPVPTGRPAILDHRVDLEVVGLQVGVCKTGGAQWDGPGTVDDERQRALVGMVQNAVDPSTIASQVAAWGGEGSARPDPFGFIELRGPSTPARFQDKRLPLDKRSTFAKDTFTPRFARSYGFRGLTFTEQDAVQVTVYDMEFQDKELIGVAEIPFARLAAAFDAKQVTPVYVGDQTNGQLLYVLITVRPSSNTGEPEARGPLY